MSDINLANLSPDEKDQLLTQLIAAHQSGAAPADPSAVPAAGSSDGDEAAGGDPVIGSILKVVEVLINVVDQQSQELAMLKKVVMDDLVGGIETLYQNNVKATAVDGLRGKYGDLFAPHLDAMKEIAPDEDLFDKLHELISNASGGDGWDDAKEGDLAKQFSDAIGAKISKVSAAKPVAPAEVAPAAVEVTKVASADPEGADPVLMNRIREMKARNKAMGK